MNCALLDTSMKFGTLIVARGGTLGYFLGGYVRPGTPNWHPVLEMGQFFIPRSRIRPKTDIPRSRNGPIFYTPS